MGQLRVKHFAYAVAVSLFVRDLHNFGLVYLYLSRIWRISWAMLVSNFISKVQSPTNLSIWLRVLKWNFQPICHRNVCVLCVVCAAEIPAFLSHLRAFT